MAYEFKFPDLGEGTTEGELLAWKVREGDEVSEGQTLAEVETDKAVVELPSPRAGRVTRLHAADGDLINVGDVVVTIAEAEAAEPAAAEAAPYTGSVVGMLEEAAEEATPVVLPQAGEEMPAPAPAAAGGPAEPKPGVLAMPSVRALAKELGVDLNSIRGTGAGGRILKQDVQDVAQSAAYGAQVAGAAAGGSPPEPAGPVAPPVGETAVAEAIPTEASVLGGAIQETDLGPVERVAFRSVRRTMAKRMIESATRQAHVTAMDEADVTVIRRIREKEREVAAERRIRLTYLAFVVKACTAALKRFPRLNASLEESHEEFILKRYYNLGIAVDTPAGLVVPNIKDADKKSIFRIAEEIVDLVGRAEERRLDLVDLHGGTFTITNYGAIGGSYATPIVNYPEVAILGMGRIKEMPAVRGDQVVPRLILPLSLTFDHQLIDGAEAARFLNTIIGYLEDPDLLLLEGA